MASAAQIEANHLKFGPFSPRNCVRPEETTEYTKLSKALWKDLNPVGPVEQMLAVEIVRAAWRLHRCAVTEAENGEDPAKQAAVDRARASAHNSMRRFLNDLRQFQSDRWLRAEVLREGFDEQQIGIADTHRVIKGLSANERLKAQFLMAPIGIDPLNQTIRTQSVRPPVAQMPPVPPAAESPRQRAIASRSLPPVHPNPPPRIPNPRSPATPLAPAIPA